MISSRDSSGKQQQQPRLFLVMLTMTSRKTPFLRGQLKNQRLNFFVVLLLLIYLQYILWQNVEFCLDLNLKRIFKQEILKASIQLFSNNIDKKKLSKIICDANKIGDKIHTYWRICNFFFYERLQVRKKCCRFQTFIHMVGIDRPGHFLWFRHTMRLRSFLMETLVRKEQKTSPSISRRNDLAGSLLNRTL